MDVNKDVEKIREEYNMLKYWTFLDAANQMIPGNYWLKAQEEYLNFLKCGRIGTVPAADIAAHPFLTSVYNESIVRAAELIHAKNNEVTHIYRVVTAINFILYNMLRWEEGDNIVFTDLTYPSSTYVLLQLNRKKGVELRRVNHVNGEVHLSDLEKKIDKKTKLVCINRTYAFCGFTYPYVKELCQIAHKYGALVFDDAYQALGAIDIDVHDDNIDFLLSGSYKWQCGPEGDGIFYIREELIDQFSDCDWGDYVGASTPGVPPFTRPDHDNLESWHFPMSKTAERFNQVVVTGPSIFGWNATLKFLNDLGIRNIEKRVRRLGGYAIERLEEIGCKVLTPVDPIKRHGLIVYTTGSYEKDIKSFQRFSGPPRGEKPIKVSYRGQGGIAGIRVCTHFFNTEEDIDELIKVQKTLM